VAADPAIEIRLRDGRQELLRSPEHYDLITLDPPPPSAAGVVNLYSSDFYRLARTRLRPSGLLAQWWPLPIQNDEDSRSLVRSFLDAFPYASFGFRDFRNPHHDPQTCCVLTGREVGSTLSQVWENEDKGNHEVVHLLVDPPSAIVVLIGGIVVVLRTLALAAKYQLTALAHIAQRAHRVLAAALISLFQELDDSAIEAKSSASRDEVEAILQDLHIFLSHRLDNPCIAEVGDVEAR
jgi:hypothetical protein